ncbi:MAG TPA: hypothetical protein GXZ85_02235 [Firmicutes bacterium]|nr:hypothetical protein [Bacillota bacterium]
MRFRGFRVQVALLVFVMVFVVGLGVRYLHQQTQVIQPLTQQLQEVPGVRRVESKRGMFGTGARTAVELEVEQGASLTTVFQRVHHILSAATGEYTVTVHDAPSAAMLALFQQIQVAVEEAVITGEFTALEARVRRVAEQAGVGWELGLDRDFIYLSLTEDFHSLRRVIARDSNQGKVVVNAGGGVGSWTSG